MADANSRTTAKRSVNWARNLRHSRRGRGWGSSFAPYRAERAATSADVKPCGDEPSSSKTGLVGVRPVVPASRDAAMAPCAACVVTSGSALPPRVGRSNPTSWMPQRHPPRRVRSLAIGAAARLDDGGSGNSCAVTRSVLTPPRRPPPPWRVPHVQHCPPPPTPAEANGPSIGDVVPGFRHDARCLVVRVSD